MWKRIKSWWQPKPGPPKDLEAALDQLIKQTPPAQLALWMGMTERSAMGEAHMGIGMWIRNNWGLWKEDGDLVKWFHIRGIRHADDMSGIILTSLWRRLNNQPLAMLDQIEYHRNHWKNYGIDPDTMEEIACLKPEHQKRPWKTLKLPPLKDESKS